mmetsp:Transcript_26549/g.43868  ORF Transcript_26549/g.43868 Transcript_26549/m.43868 type:complete len:107 (+) Transcript_26549:1145-1465(+)
MESESFLSPVEANGLLGAAEDIGGKAAADDDAVGLGTAVANGLGASFDMGGKAEFDFGTLEEDFDFVESMGNAALDVDKLETSSGFDFVELSFLVGDGFEASSASR